MQVTQHKWFSPILEQEMELKVYGQGGKPVLVFPTEGGRFYEFEDFKMVKACEDFLESGKICLFTVDSVDKQSWTNYDIHPALRAIRHIEYDRYIIEEVIPFIHEHTQYGYERVLTTGCSMGGYHSANFFFRHPDVFDSVISMSGVYTLQLFIKDYMDENVYFNTPLAFLPHLTDPVILDWYRKSHIILSVGQGAWEDVMLADMQQMKAILEAKHIPAWVDFWGHDVNHDWPWWRIQFPYFLNHLPL